MILDGPVDPELSWMTAWVVAAGRPGYARTRSVISAKALKGPPVERSAVTTTWGSSRRSATSTSYGVSRWSSRDACAPICHEASRLAMNASDGARHSATEPPRRSPASARARCRSATSRRSAARLTGSPRCRHTSSAAPASSTSSTHSGSNCGYAPPVTCGYAPPATCGYPPPVTRPHPLRPVMASVLTSSRRQVAFAGQFTKARQIWRNAQRTTFHDPMRVAFTDVLPSIDLTRSGSFDKSPKPFHALEAHRQVAVAPLASRAALTSRETGAWPGGRRGIRGRATARYRLLTRDAARYRTW